MEAAILGPIGAAADEYICMPAELLWPCLQTLGAAFADGYDPYPTGTVVEMIYSFLGTLQPTALICSCD